MRRRSPRKVLREALATVAGQSPALHSMAKRVRRWWSPYLIEIIETRLRERPEAFVLQVGSNDGAAGDPIHELIRRSSGWRGLLIEPVPYVFERLKKTYAALPRFACANVAIGDRHEHRKFYYISAEAKTALGAALPATFDQLGSFERDHIRKHCSDAVEPFIVEATIETIPLDEVLARHGVTRIDLVHIDTEGFDYHVLRQVDFARFTPAVVLFEHSHLGPEEMSAAESLLTKHGYRLKRLKTDTLAIHRDSN